MQRMLTYWLCSRKGGLKLAESIVSYEEVWRIHCIMRRHDIGISHRITEGAKRETMNGQDQPLYDYTNVIYVSAHNPSLTPLKPWNIMEVSLASIHGEVLTSEVTDLATWVVQLFLTQSRGPDVSIVYQRACDAMGRGFLLTYLSMSKQMANDRYKILLGS